MRIQKVITTTEDHELDILGATLLSVDEVEKYLPEEKRYYSAHWWLRTSGTWQFGACSVDPYGYIITKGNVVSYPYNRVRPALLINISNTDIKVGDVFIFADKEFEVISENLAWMHKSDIGEAEFKEDRDCEEANVYENSDVKKKVNRWFETASKEN